MGGAPTNADKSADAASRRADDPAVTTDPAAYSTGRSATVDDTNVWQRIREHKIIQWGLGYFAAALALAHAEELIAHAYGWPESVGQILIAIAGLGLPVALTLAWYHGHRASRHVSGAEASILAILLLLGSGLLWVLVRPHEGSPSAPASKTASVTPARSRPPQGKPRIAVLPFENLSPDPNNAFFTDGLHEEILSTLANRAPGLEVISRTTMMLYRSAPKSVEEIARTLGATHVLEGSVRREGNTVRLTLQLIDAKSDGHVWSQDYDRTLTSALALQSEVAAQVAAQLAVELVGHAIKSGPPTLDPQAYDLYLEARLARQRISPLDADFKPVNDLLEQAILRDPNFALARMDLATNELLLYETGSDESHLQRARQQLDAARTLIPEAPEFIIAEAVYNYLTSAGAPLTPQVESALSEVAQDAGNLTCASGALLFDQADRFADTLALCQRLVRLDPANNALHIVIINQLVALRRTQEVRHAFEFFAPQGYALFGGPQYLFRLSGRAKDLRDMRAGLDQLAPRLPSDERFSDEFQTLVYEHRFADLKKLFDPRGPYATDSTIARFSPDSVGIGRRPVAEFAGWAALLLNDVQWARAQSKTLAEFAAHRPKSELRAWYTAALKAQAQLFAGDNTGAIRIAHESLADRPRSKDASTWKQVGSLNARILAWAGAGDQAVQLLADLSTVDGGLLPAEIVRDPLYDVPLAGNPRYQSLKVKLEAQIAAMKFE